MRKGSYSNAMLIILIAGIFCLFIIQDSSALSAKPSNESIQAKEGLGQAEKDILEMMENNISINRVNETYQEALQLYSAQLALEEKGKKADYKLIIKYTSDIGSVKKTALQAKDELEIFSEIFNEVGENTNLSEMHGEYDQIISSLSDERFEDTIKLIKTGYERISEIQSSQTAINAFSNAISKTIKNFFIRNWLKLIIIFSIVLILLLIFWSSLKKLKVRLRFNLLITQKKSINNLLKKMQNNYFKTKKISEADYRIRLKKFKELIRDIDRQVMVLKEEIYKSKKKRR
ncbi:hypothetical protein COU56_01185 [Candidatus Pacearchaeota archaeon CG10_big_fil_rev_8_21_14_0_10_31_9]|nr:MAG: hypothetical protein COU56_01185 [Candidatus Pacearchaeota archaeon CG10_big_fil_rev_8_21_14_0_10_31_9]